MMCDLNLTYLIFMFRFVELREKKLTLEIMTSCQHFYKSYKLKRICLSHYITLKIKFYIIDLFNIFNIFIYLLSICFKIYLTLYGTNYFFVVFRDIT